ncbi:hypothetical protein GCM10015536_35350 [Streptomyces griseomycini]|nr:hypothetical protein GCM10015536_35350 [Streptomyces griseomycini]
MTEGEDAGALRNAGPDRPGSHAAGKVRTGVDAPRAGPPRRDGFGAHGVDRPPHVLGLLAAAFGPQRPGHPAPRPDEANGTPA